MRKLDADEARPSLAFGVLGLNELTAYFGLLETSNPQVGETVVVSTAAGAVGSCIGKFAKFNGCRTAGIAGGPDKVAKCINEFGYDAAIDYQNTDNLGGELSAACPDGVNVYFDNTCGSISEAVFERLALHARITVCGTASLQEWEPVPMGPRVHRQLLVARARMTGFLIHDNKDRIGEALARLSAWTDSGKLVSREHVLDGIDHALGAFEMFYRVENTGKLIIKLD